MGTKRSPASVNSTTGWRPLTMLTPPAVLTMRAAIAVTRGDFGEIGEHIDLRQHARQLLDAFRFHRHRAAQRGEELELEFLELIFRAQHHRLIFFQRRGDVTFGVGERLLADVIARAPRPGWRGSPQYNSRRRC